MNVRVAYVITDSGFGGSESVLLHLLSKMNRARVAPVGVVVLKTKREMAREWEKAGVPVKSLGMGWRPSPATLFRLKNSLGQFNPDVVHAFLFHSIQLTRIVKKFGGLGKLISSPRVNYRFIPAWARFLDSRLKSWDDGTLSESRASAEYLEKKLGYDPKKIRVVSNGVEASGFISSAEERARVRREWGVSDNEILVGGVGRLHDQKGFDILLESMAQLNASPIRHRLVLVGEGPEQRRLMTLAKSVKVEPIFAGKRTDMPAVYAALDIFVQSSRYEGMSNALLEALAAGKPCVATAVDGTLDIARDGVNVLLVKPQDPTHLSVAIGLLLEKKDLRARLSTEAQETAKNFSLETMVRSFENAYEEIFRL